MKKQPPAFIKSFFMSIIIFIGIVTLDFFVIKSNFFKPLRVLISKKYNKTVPEDKKIEGISYHRTLEKNYFQEKIYQFFKSKLADYEKDKARIIKKINPNVPPVFLVLKSNRKLAGRILEETDKYFLFETTYGHSGYLRRKINKSEILRIKNVLSYQPDINFYEYRIANKFSDFYIYQDGQRTFITDSDYLVVEDMASMLNSFFDEIRSHFSDFFIKEIRPVSNASRTIVLMFNAKKDLDNFWFELSGNQEAPFAFYWTDNLTLVLFNTYSEKFTKPLKDTLRHEATHYFFHNYFLWHTQPYIWYNEGLAEYCSTEPIGDIIDENKQAIIKAFKNNSLPAVQKFFNEQHTFYGKNPHLNYSLAWAAVFYAMEKHRQYFYNYLQDLKEKKGKLSQDRHEAVFKKHFGISFQQYFNIVVSTFTQDKKFNDFWFDIQYTRNKNGKSFSYKPQ